MRDYAEFDSMTIQEKARTLRGLRVDVRKLESIYSESNSPKAAVEQFQKATSKRRASEVIASLVNYSSWDGRICRKCTDWAKRVENAWDEKSMNKMGVYTSIHPAHLDQLAYEIARTL